MENLLSSALKPDTAALDRVRDRPAPRPDARVDRAFDRHLDDIDRDRNESRPVNRDQPERRRAAEPNSRPDTREREPAQARTDNRDERRRPDDGETSKTSRTPNEDNAGQKASTRDETRTGDQPDQADGSRTEASASAQEESDTLDALPPASTNSGTATESDGTITQSDLAILPTADTQNPVFLLESDAVVADPRIAPDQALFAESPKTEGSSGAADISAELAFVTPEQIDPSVTALDDSADKPLGELVGKLTGDSATIALAGALRNIQSNTESSRIGQTGGTLPAGTSPTGPSLPTGATAPVAPTAPAAADAPLTLGLPSSLAGTAGPDVGETPATSTQQGGGDTAPRFEDALKTAQGPDKAQIAQAALNFANTKAQAEAGPPAAPPPVSSLDSLFAESLTSATGTGALQGTAGDATPSLRFTTLARGAQITNVPVHTLAFHVARQVDNGVNRFQIKLDPPELGRLDVTLEMKSEGGVKLHLTVERPEALDFLQRDARALEKALNDAGLDADSGSLSFSLEDNDQQFDDGEDSDAPHTNAPEHLANEDGPAASLMTGYISPTGVDIHI